MTSTLDRFRGTRQAQEMPDFSDDMAAANYINENTAPDIVAVPVTEGVMSVFVDAAKKEWRPVRDPSFLRVWAEQIWQGRNRQQ